MNPVEWLYGMWKCIMESSSDNFSGLCSCGWIKTPFQIQGFSSRIGDFLNARWQQTYQVNVLCLHSSEHVRITKNNGFYLLSLLPPSVPEVPYWLRLDWPRGIFNNLQCMRSGLQTRGKAWSQIQSRSRGFEKDLCMFSISRRPSC